jgi:hypothetical protein
MDIRKVVSGAILDSGCTVLGLGVAMVGMFDNTGAPREAIVGDMAYGAIRAVNGTYYGCVRKSF